MTFEGKYLNKLTQEATPDWGPQLNTSGVLW